MDLSDVAALIDQWCPAGFEHESLTARTMRALMNANACVLDLQRVTLGEQPIRPLDTYPINGKTERTF